MLRPRFILRPARFSLKTILWLTLVVSAFFAGIRFEQERRNEAEAARMHALPVFTHLHDYNGLQPLPMTSPYSPRLPVTGR